MNILSPIGRSISWAFGSACLARGTIEVSKKVENRTGYGLGRVFNQLPDNCKLPLYSLALDMRYIVQIFPNKYEQLCRPYISNATLAKRLPTLVINPIVEEMLFRVAPGLLSWSLDQMDLIDRRVHRVFMISISSIFFALAHQPGFTARSFNPLTIAGLTFGILYESSENFFSGYATAVLAHSFFNALTLFKG